MTEEALLVTSDEFVTDLLCELALHDVRQLTLGDTMADRRFEKAFGELVERQDELGVSLDFSLAVNPYHGDSSTLRETLYGLRERGVVSINNPSFKTVEFNLDNDDAQHFLSRSSLPKSFLEQIVSRHFTDGEPPVDHSEGGRRAAPSA